MQVMVLSPHRDDAAFSCGLLLADLLEAGCSVRIVNVCTISSYAPYMEESTGDRTEQVTDWRSKEDDRFIETLCSSARVEDASIELIDLGWKDLPLRWQTEDAAAIAAATLRDAEIEALRNALAVLPDADLVLAPEGVGGHLDHRLVHHVAQQTFPAPRLVFYEDLPYACSQSRRAKHTEAMTEMWLPEGPITPGRKLEFCLCYPSQIDRSLAEVMDRYGQQHGGERLLAHPESLNMLRAALQITEANA